MAGRRLPWGAQGLLGSTFCTTGEGLYVTSKTSVLWVTVCIAGSTFCIVGKTFVTMGKTVGATLRLSVRLRIPSTLCGRLSVYIWIRLSVLQERHSVLPVTVLRLRFSVLQLGLSVRLLGDLSLLSEIVCELGRTRGQAAVYLRQAAVCLGKPRGCWGVFSVLQVTGSVL